MAFNLRNRSFLTLRDYSAGEIGFLLKLAADLKAANGPVAEIAAAEKALAAWEAETCQRAGIPLEDIRQQRVEAGGMVEMGEVRYLVRHHRAADMVRRHDQPPVDPDRAIGRAAAPAARGVADGERRDGDARAAAIFRQIRRAQPLPKPPADMLNNGSIEIVAPFVYSLERRR